MSHANASLTPRGRLRVAVCHVRDGVSLRATAERFQVSTTTVSRWADRYREVLVTGREPRVADMVDRSSRPHRCPTTTRRPLVRKIVHLRVKKRLGPVQIGGRIGVPASTVHAVLVRERLNRLAWVDRATGLPVRGSARPKPVRYERPHPGDLVHVDVKKLAVIPDGGGWRIHGQAATGKGRDQRRRANRAARTARGSGSVGYTHVHSALDDHSRLTYSEIHDDETAETAVAFWGRAEAFFADHGITVLAVMTDNGPCYLSSAWKTAMTGDDPTHPRIQHIRTRPYRPQTNGKVERFNRTLLTEWAYARAYTSEKARRAALDKWLHIYNHHRAHSSLGGRPPINRVPNLPGQNT